MTATMTVGTAPTKLIAQIWKLAPNYLVPAAQTPLSLVAMVAVSTWVGSVTEIGIVQMAKMSWTALTLVGTTRSSARTSRAASANTGGAMARGTVKMDRTKINQNVRRGLAIRTLTSSVLKVTASPEVGCAMVTTTAEARTERRVQTKTLLSATTSAKKTSSNVPTTDVSSTTSFATGTTTAKITVMSQACVNTKFVQPTL